MKMKSEVLLMALSLHVAMDLGAQGYIAFKNLPPAAGLVYYSENQNPGAILLNQDANFQLLGGADPFNLQPIQIWLLSDGTATGINVAPGRFADPSGGVYAVPGVQAGGIAYLQVFGWSGNFDTREAAAQSGAAGVAVFQNPTGNAYAAPGLTGMNGLIIGIPEPSSLALSCCGGLMLATRLLRVRKG